MESRRLAHQALTAKAAGAAASRRPPGDAITMDFLYSHGAITYADVYV
jgi:hypothetical protein